MSEPTPRPWRTDPSCEHEAVLGPDGTVAADCCVFHPGNPEANKRAQPNAALIVRAVNAHDELVAALSEIVTRLGNGEPYCGALDDMARAALTKAKGQEP